MSDTIEFSIPIHNDAEGFFGRECPNEECLGYFKIELGTGLKGEDLPCHCPYCGHTNSHDHFWTQDQLEYAQSVAMRKVQEHVFIMLEDTLKPSRSRRQGLISISWELKPGEPLPLHRYTEKELETKLVCNQCGLRYAVYGVFAYCPDCGTHNSLQMLSSNLDLANKELDLARTVNEPLAGQLVSDALENAVAAFDAFGREYFRANADLASEPQKASTISCQNLTRLDDRLGKLFDIDIKVPFDVEEWGLLARAFQKRHLLAHKMGVIDDAYIMETSDPQAVKGRKVVITTGEVRKFIPLVLRLGQHIQSSIERKR